MQYMALAIQTVFLLCSTLLTPGQTGSLRLVTSSGNPRMPPVMVMGFVGGFVRHDNIVHSGVQLAQHLRRDYPSDVYVEVFENRRREKAHQEILRLLDTNHDGRLSVEERHSARIIIYGMSWGGAETVTLAEELEKDGIPMLLTIQVDSISKIRQNCHSIQRGRGHQFLSAAWTFTRPAKHSGRRSGPHANYWKS